LADVVIASSWRGFDKSVFLFLSKGESFLMQGEAAEAIKFSITDGIAAFGALLTGAALIYTGIQVRLARKSSRSQFLLQLYQMMDQHNDVHAQLTRTGWSNGKNGPNTPDEWIKVGRVLGLFEYIQILVEDGLIDIDTVDRLYSYRLFHLINNEVIRKTHFETSTNWSGIIKLLKQLENKEIFASLAQSHNVNFLISDGDPNKAPISILPTKAVEKTDRKSK
jgi:hypothetical protein